MPKRELSAPCHSCRLRDGLLTFDELVELLVSSFDPSSLSANRAVELLFVVDYIRAELCAAHHDTFRALRRGEPEPGAIF